MPWMAIAGAGAGLASGVVGDITASGAQQDALNQEQQAAQNFIKLAVPDPVQQRLALQQYQLTGRMSPQLEQAYQQAKSEMSNIQQDPTEKAAQLSALNGLSDIASRGGHTLQQDAYLNDLENQVAAKNRGRIGAIQSSFAQRGMGQPGGLEMAAQLQNAQNEAQQENQGSMDAAAQAQQAALQALQNEGSLAGQIRGQDFNQQAQIAKAQDEINRFNTAALQSAENANVANNNRAQAYNLDRAQQIADRNTNLENYQQQYNKNLLQQQFNNEMQKASGEANAQNAVANQYNNIANTDANMWSGIGQGLTTAGVAGQMWKDNQNNQNSDNSDEEGG